MISLLPWITIFWSLVVWFADDFHSSRRHSGKSLINQLTRGQRNRCSRKLMHYSIYVPCSIALYKQSGVSSKSNAVTIRARSRVIQKIEKKYITVIQHNPKADLWYQSHIISEKCPCTNFTQMGLCWTYSQIQSSALIARSNFTWFCIWYNSV